MTDLARGLWCGAFGANGDSDGNEPSAARASRPSRCRKASEPRPPAEIRRNDRRLREKFESVHIKKGVARQQHLAEIGPNADGSVRAILVNDVLFFNEVFRGGEFLFSRRTAVGQFKSKTVRRLQ